MIIKAQGAPAPQTKLIGPGSLQDFGGLLARMNPPSAMLITGGHGYLGSGAQELIEPALARLEVVRMSGVSANPEIAEVKRGVSLWRKARPPLVVAAGGGSVIDVAKLIGLFGPFTAPWETVPDDRDRARDPVSVIAIPTTAGSGAEATRFATFYDAGQKRSISHPLLRPAYAIVDALLTASMPPRVAASTGLDAMAQAIESLWAISATPKSRALAEAALREILPSLGQIVHAPTPGLRERMAHGAHLAGQAIDLSRTTAAHALSYALTADLGLAHGHAVALLLPAIFRINAQPDGRPVQNPPGAATLADTMGRIVRLLGCGDGEEAARFLERQVAALGLATRLPAWPAGISPASLAAKANAERLGNNPVALSADDVFGIYARLARDRKPT